ncbi:MULTISPECIES: sugar phosphate isomerase/epimerase [unclassified Oceanispirochaeta]|uniref:sugar phosphate isomerase/epimerase family protein n=1 Tax=unclassified Oceanispirochaeta TaxID=2635722 RepID=UPI000E090F9D|nr:MULTISPECIES: sugar phosphate isomerase/epimerase family protein [unclassified Oceanispirochaeta]MBF9016977.1 sugar phosphate isomerase/epimerase [Oceanispirochaeta sp. M2]NPD73340.1 sugar phosphate isomerase/epimerase [Oceanispirochaeta sp. M1]RDG30999.1 sugar phosphate isomerase/epimerase [Oceanispirochaeta sp. M1]
MKYGLHGLLVRYSNVATDIRIAADAGYDAVELHTDKLDRYLASGFTGKDLNLLLEKHSMKVSCIDIIGDVESQKPEVFGKVMDKAALLIDTAVEIGCPTIQLNAFMELADKSVDENIKLTAANIRKICELGQKKGIRFQYEGAAWTPIHSIEQCRMLVEEVGVDNFGFVVDFWHFWASRGGTPEDIAKLNSNMIYGVHIADGFRPAEGEAWVDETLLRGALPGDGEINIAEWIDAVKSTGYDGYYSGEILCHKLWEADLIDIASDTLSRMKKYF